MAIRSKPSSGAIKPASTVAKPTWREFIPQEWIRGQLLDLQRYSDGTFKALLLGDKANDEGSNVLNLPSAHEAQELVSWWYQRDHSL